MYAASIYPQIARLLNKTINLIKCVEEWTNCYFVRFVFGSPKFVSKNLIKPIFYENMTAEIEKTNCRVIARTDVRRARVAGIYANEANSRGLLVQELDSKEEYWVNNWRVDRFDPDKGDLIVCVVDGAKNWIEPIKVDYPVEQRYPVYGVADTHLENQGAQDTKLVKPTAWAV